MYPYEFVQYDTTDYGYYFATPFSLLTTPTPGHYPRAVILDKDGYITWYSTNNTVRYFNFQYQPDTNLFSCYFWNNPFGYVFMDSTFNIVDTVSMYNGLPINLHEFQILPNGNIIYFAYKDSVMDLSAYTFGGVQGSATTHVAGDVILEFDQAHNLVFQWSSFNHISTTETYDQYGYYANSFDYIHSNSISIDVDGNILASYRNLNAVYKINHSNGNVIWRLGGKLSSFTFPNDTGFCGQHDVRCYPGGIISVFDNATTLNQCRAVMYSLDTVAWTATKIWEYKPDPAFPSTAMGNHQITADSNHLIDFGESRRPYSSMDFVDNMGNKITQIFFEDSILSYRIYVQKVPYTFPRPKITCTLGTNAINLFAPAGYQSYKWSTGATSDHITVSDTGVYQVWVNYGIGMLGSKPFFINNISTACTTMGIQEPQTEPYKGDYIIYDVLGRIISKPEIGHVYIYRYNNGFSEIKCYSGGN